MSLGFSLFPEQASTMAGRVDALFFFLIGVAVFFVSLIFFLVVFFAVKYRRRSEDERPMPITGNLALEIFWIVVPLGLTMVMFIWGALLFFDTYHPPKNAVEINVVAKQWMWKAQHETGQRQPEDDQVWLQPEDGRDGRREQQRGNASDPPKRRRHPVAHPRPHDVQQRTPEDDVDRAKHSGGKVHPCHL